MPIKPQDPDLSNLDLHLLDVVTEGTDGLVCRIVDLTQPCAEHLIEAKRDGRPQGAKLFALSIVDVPHPARVRASGDALTSYRQDHTRP
jgi:hypothetical protein